MVIVMKDTAVESDIAAVSEQLRLKGFDVHRVDGVNRTVLGAIGDKRDVDPREFEILKGVHEVFRISEPYKLASRTFHPENSIIKIGDVRFGDNDGGVTTAGAGDAEIALRHWLADMEGAGDLPRCIEIALTRAQGRGVRPRRHGPVGRDRGYEKVCRDITGEFTSARPPGVTMNRGFELPRFPFGLR